MSDFIRLTSAQHIAASRAVTALRPGENSPGDLVNTVIDAVNVMRETDDEGTIRRDVDGECLAIRREDHWLLVWPGNATQVRRGPLDLDQWPYVYVPRANNGLGA